jgi:hypothetical protein
MSVVNAVNSDLCDAAVDVAAKLWGDTPNYGVPAEYLRGMAELLADLFPEPGVFMDERVPAIAAEIVQRGAKT